MSHTLSFISTAALEFLKSHPVDPIDVAAFELDCGVGVVITPEQITEQVCCTVNMYMEKKFI